MVKKRKLKRFYINYKGKKTLISVIKFKKTKGNKHMYGFTYKHPRTKGMRVMDIYAKNKPDAIKEFKKKVIAFY